MAETLPGTTGGFAPWVAGKGWPQTASARGVNDVVDEVQAPGRRGVGFDHVRRRHTVGTVARQIQAAQLTVAGDQKKDAVLLIDYWRIVHCVGAATMSKATEARPGWGRPFARRVFPCLHRAQRPCRRRQADKPGFSRLGRW